MSRPLRIVALSTALVLALTAAPAAAFAESTDELPATSARTPTLSAAAAAPSGVRPAFGGAAVETDPVAVDPAPAAPSARSAQGADARAVSTKWPVRTRTGDATYHPVTPGGDLSQRFKRVVMVQDRLYGTLSASIVLQGTPTSATDSRLRLGFGRITQGESGPVCTPTARSVDVDRHSWVEGTTSTIRYRVALAGAKTETYNCSFALMVSADNTTVYDAVTDGRLTEARQKPILGFRIPGKRLNRSGFTRIPIRILNSRATVATAYKTRLVIRSRGAAVRYNPRVGTIKPGAGKKGAFFIKKTRRGVVPVTFIVRSKDYRKKIVLRIRPVR